jgi:3-deoxy-D-manno-octulosonate 8-phosphate phosphatase (KDO 8-P phosphatase)
MEKAGFKATPADGTSFIKKIADYICENKSGNGAFREVAELIIAFNINK